MAGLLAVSVALHMVLTRLFQAHKYSRDRLFTPVSSFDVFEHAQEAWQGARVVRTQESGISSCQQGSHRWFSLKHEPPTLRKQADIQVVACPLTPPAFTGFLSGSAAIRHPTVAAPMAHI